MHSVSPRYKKKISSYRDASGAELLLKPTALSASQCRDSVDPGHGGMALGNRQGHVDGRKEEAGATF